MPDDPSKRGPADRKRTSQQEHEQDYQKKKGKKDSEEQDTRKAEPQKKPAPDVTRPTDTDG